MVGVFIIAALGTDAVLVCNDKWVAARLAQPNTTTKKITTNALPGAASAMLLATLTTVVEFIVNSTIKIASILCFWCVYWNVDHYQLLHDSIFVLPVLDFE